MQRVGSFFAVLLLSAVAGCGSENETEESAGEAETPVTDESGSEKEEPEESAEEEPPLEEIDLTKGQSTGAQTKDVPGQDHRNTLVDAEIGVQITCPVDKTWKCKLDGDGMWKIKDMSSNKFQVRVVADVENAAEALEREIAYATQTLPVSGEAEKGEAEAVLDVGPNPDWAKKVPRRAWIQVKEIGGGWYACHGVGPEKGYDNASKDYRQLCESLAAASDS